METQEDNKMSFKDYLKEKFLQGTKATDPFGDGDQYTEIFENPDSGEINSIAKNCEYPMVRLGWHNNRLLAWCDMVTHSRLAETIPDIKYGFDFMMEYNPKTPQFVLVSPDENEDWQDKVTPDLIKRLREAFP